MKCDRLPRLHPWTARRWCRYFHRQSTTLLAIPWQRGSELTPAEKDLVAPSLQEFQQAEGMEGGHFFRCVRNYGAMSGDWDYVEAHRLFMAEEQRHGRQLGTFLDLADIPRLERVSWFTWMFCWLGSRGGLEPTLIIILMSEIFGQVYYTALRTATRSTTLRRLCDQILRDEKSHVRFQAERLAVLRRRRGWLGMKLRHGLDLLMFVGAGLACWFGHHRVLWAGGYGVWRYWSLGARCLRAAWKLKNPVNYQEVPGLCNSCRA
jgi:hypothetical protein